MRSRGAIWLVLVGGLVGWALLFLVSWPSGEVVLVSTQPSSVRYDTDPGRAPYRVVVREAELECCALIPPLERRYEVYIGRDAADEIAYGVFLDLPEAPFDEPEAYFAAMEVRWSPGGVRLVAPSGEPAYEFFLSASRFAGGR